MEPDFYLDGAHDDGGGDDGDDESDDDDDNIFATSRWLFFIIFEQWMVEKDKELMDMEEVEEVDEEAEIEKETWVSVSFNSAVNSALSAIDKYCFSCKL